MYSHLHLGREMWKATVHVDSNGLDRKASFI